MITIYLFINIIPKSLDGTLTTIEFQREALENAQSNTQIIQNMDYAAKALKKAHNGLDVDKVDDLMADIQEQQDVAQEIADAIAKPMGFQVNIFKFLEVYEFINLKWSLDRLTINIIRINVATTALNSNWIWTFINF